MPRESWSWTENFKKTTCPELGQDISIRDDDGKIVALIQAPQGTKEVVRTKPIVVNCLYDFQATIPEKRSYNITFLGDHSISEMRQLKWQIIQKKVDKP
jgi:hypothetical protein